MTVLRDPDQVLRGDVVSLLDQAFQDQVKTSVALDSPFMARLMALLPQVLPNAPHLYAVMSSWPGDVSSRGASLPLRLAGGLHALVRSGHAPGLAQCYPPNPHHGLREAVAEALVVHESWLLDWMNLPPQTNEVGRSAALIAAARFVMSKFNLPLRLSELGASAGLNLNFHLFALATGPEQTAKGNGVNLRPVWTGPQPPDHRVKVLERRGVDLSPVDPVSDGERLMAFVWPDQTERLERLRRALDLAQEHPVPVDQGDAAGWLEQRLSTDAGNLCHFVYHTIAHQYFPTDTQARIRAAMARAGASASPDTPLAWFGMEADDTPHGAALTLRLWPGPEMWVLGRAGFHGQWVDWRPKRL